MEFQQRLYDLRKKAGLSQEGLADLLGVTRQAVQKWEAGTSRPDMDNLAALARYFNVTLDYLVTGEEPPAPAVQEDDPQPVKEPAQEEVSTQPEYKEVVYTWPVKGQVLRAFTAEALAYDPTMGDWRTHCGVDIAAEAGLKVLAAGEGQVAEVCSDPMMGTTVTVQQPDGVTAVYSNLAEEVAVSVGDAVETGAVLGTVGGTAIAESGMESHLHLELLAEGNHVDPLDYLPEQS